MAKGIEFISIQTAKLTASFFLDYRIRSIKYTEQRAMICGATYGYQGLRPSGRFSVQIPHMYHLPSYL